ncbi:tyrosine-type recombinase/integrase [Herbaspirillum huttiense]|uniref:tyrosine-type recombinase/integrase n=1 Tax=Herbaspirillum huttiense TaxID=863372 RepID=UPI0039AFBE7D
MKKTQQLFSYEGNEDSAFEAWVSSVPGRGKSKKVKEDTLLIYKYQWNQFRQYLEKHDLTIFQVTSTHVDAFLAEKAWLQEEDKKDKKGKKDKSGLNRYEQVIRYRRLLERVFQDIMKKHPDKISINPAAFPKLDSKTWSDATKRDLREFLTQDERAVIERLLNLAKFQDFSPYSSPKEVSEFRPYVITALMIGGGLKSGEIIALTVSSLDLTAATLRVAHADSDFTRKIELDKQGYLAALLAKWMVYWEENLDASQGSTKLLFPRLDLHGKPTGGEMASTTLQRNVRALFEQALHHPDVGSPGLRQRAAEALASRGNTINPQVLRNTYVARLFEQGKAVDDVAAHMQFSEKLIADRIWVDWLEWRAKYDKQGFLAWAESAAWDRRLLPAMLKEFDPATYEPLLQSKGIHPTHYQALIRGLD